MIIQYRIKPPISVGGVAAADPGIGTYLDGTGHKVKAYAYKVIAGVGILVSTPVVSALVVAEADETTVTWTVVPAAAPQGNEPHYELPDGYIFLKWDEDTCQFNFDAYFLSVGNTVLPDTGCSVWSAGVSYANGLNQSEIAFAITPQADIPRANPLYTVAGAAQLVILINNAIANAAASGNSITHGSGSPEGVVTANIGDLYIDVGAAFPVIWIKQTGDGTNTGWHS